MIARTTAAPIVVLRLSEAEQATVTGMMDRMKVATGRHVEAHEAVRAAVHHTARAMAALGDLGLT